MDAALPDGQYTATWVLTCAVTWVLTCAVTCVVPATLPTQTRAAFGVLLPITQVLTYYTQVFS